jgi:hypothetical protein
MLLHQRYETKKNIDVRWYSRIECMKEEELAQNVSLFATKKINRELHIRRKRIKSTAEDHG